MSLFKLFRGAKMRQAKQEKKFLTSFVQFFVVFFRDFFADLFSVFTADPKHSRNSFDDDDLRWRTMEAGEFLRHTGFEKLGIISVVE